MFPRSSIWKLNLEFQRYPMPNSNIKSLTHKLKSKNKSERSISKNSIHSFWRTFQMLIKKSLSFSIFVFFCFFCFFLGFETFLVLMTLKLYIFFFGEPSKLQGGLYLDHSNPSIFLFVLIYSPCIFFRIMILIYHIPIKLNNSIPLPHHSLYYFLFTSQTKKKRKKQNLV